MARKTNSFDFDTRSRIENKLDNERKINSLVQKNIKSRVWYFVLVVIAIAAGAKIYLDTQIIQENLVKRGYVAKGFNEDNSDLIKSESEFLKKNRANSISQKLSDNFDSDVTNSEKATEGLSNKLGKSEEVKKNASNGQKQGLGANSKNLYSPYLPPELEQRILRENAELLSTSKANQVGGQAKIFNKQGNIPKEIEEILLSAKADKNLTKEFESKDAAAEKIKKVLAQMNNVSKSEKYVRFEKLPIEIADDTLFAHD